MHRVAAVLTLCGLSIARATDILNIGGGCDAKSIAKGIFSNSATSGVTNSLGAFSQFTPTGSLDGITDLLGGGSSSGSSTPSKKNCLTQFGGTSLDDNFFGKVIIGCIGTAIEKKLQECQNDILKKELNSAGCLIGGLPGGIGNIFSSFTGGGGASGIPGIGNLPGIGRKKRQLPNIPGIGNLGSLTGGAAGGAASGASSAGDCVSPAELPKKLCELEAAKKNCVDLQKQVDDPNCDICQMMALAMKSDDIDNCACKNIPSSGFDPSQLQSTIGGCVADQAAGSILKDQLLSNGQLSAMFGKVGDSGLDFLSKCNTGSSGSSGSSIPDVSALTGGAVPNVGSGGIPGVGSGGIPGVGSGSVPGVGSGSIPGVGGGGVPGLGSFGK